MPAQSLSSDGERTTFVYLPRGPSMKLPSVGGVARIDGGRGTRVGSLLVPQPGA